MCRRVLGVLLAALICVSGCFAQARADATLLAGINMFMDCFAALEGMFVVQLDMIHTAQAFMDAPDAQRREALSRTEVAAHARLSTIKLPPSALAPEVYAALLENDMDPSMFEALLTHIGYQLETFPSAITAQAAILRVLYDAGEAGAARKYLQHSLAYIQSEMRGTYYDINAIFVGQEGEALVYVMEAAAQRLPYLSALGLPWESDLEAIMDKQTLELDLMAEQIDALEAFENEYSWLLTIGENSMETYRALATLLERRTAENSSFVRGIKALRGFVQGVLSQAQARQAIGLSISDLSREDEANPLLASTSSFAEMEQECATLSFYLELLYTLLATEGVDKQTVQAMTDIFERYLAARIQTEIALVHEFALLEAADGALFRQVMHSAFVGYTGSDTPWTDDIQAVLTQHIAALEAMKQALEDFVNLAEEIWGE